MIQLAICGVKEAEVLMLSYFTAYASSLVSFLALDAVWLSIMVPRVYRPGMTHLMGDGFNLPAAAVFYLLYAVGMVVIAIMPAGKASQALFNGAMLGLIAYGTYDLTNQATLRDWPWNLTVLDMAWGTIATALASAIAFYAVNALHPN